MNINNTPRSKELSYLAKLAGNPRAFAPDAPIPDMPIPDTPILDGPAYRREWDPARFSSFAEYERARKKAQDAINEYELHCWLRTLPPKERAATWRYVCDMRAWQNNNDTPVSDIPLLEHYGL